MKSNVDLTVDRDFARGRRSLLSRESLLMLLNITGRYIFPWDIITSAEPSYMNNHNELVLTGSKAERNEKRKNDNYYKYCSECNGPLSIFPWREDNRLSCCDACRKEYDPFYNIDGWVKYPWEDYNKPHPTLDITRLEDNPTVIDINLLFGLREL